MIDPINSSCTISEAVKVSEWVRSGGEAENQLLSISEAAREAGVNRSTIQRWLKAKPGRLKKQAEGKVWLYDVLREKDKKRNGRSHGSADSKKPLIFTESPLKYAPPFLDGRGGITRLRHNLRFIAKHHIEQGRLKMIYKTFIEAAEYCIEPERFRPKERRWKSRQRLDPELELLRDSGLFPPLR